MTIDMKDYAGETAPAAVEQKKVETNSYQQELQQDYPAPPVEKVPGDNGPVEPPQENPQDRNFRRLTEEVDRIKAERETEKREFQNQIEMLRANASQGKPPQEANRQMFDHMNENDVPSVSEIRREWAQRESVYESQLEELRVAQQHPDYAEVLQKYAAPLMKEKPHLLKGVLASENKAQALYDLGVMQKELQAMKSTAAPKQKSMDAQKIVENAQKPGNIAQTGGQGVLSNADYYATMSDKDFMKFASKHLEGI